MANGQYIIPGASEMPTENPEIIPGTHENEALRHMVNEAFKDVLTENPELSQRAEFAEIYDIGIDLDEKRAFATEADFRKAKINEIVS